MAAVKIRCFWKLFTNGVFVLFTNLTLVWVINRETSAIFKTKICNANFEKLASL